MSAPIPNAGPNGSYSGYTLNSPVTDQNPHPRWRFLLPLFGLRSGRGPSPAGQGRRALGAIFKDSVARARKRMDLCTSTPHRLTAAATVFLKVL